MNRSQWLHLPADEVRSDVPLALWEIEGGTLRVMEDGERATVVDDQGGRILWDAREARNFSGFG